MMRGWKHRCWTAGEALKRIFQRRNMEGTKEATIVGISTLSCSRPQTLPLSAHPALRLGIWFAWVCEKMPLTLRAVGAEPGERTPDRLGEERNTSKGRSCGRNISECQAGRPWPGPRTRQPAASRRRSGCCPSPRERNGLRRDGEQAPLSSSTVGAEVSGACAGT